MYSKDELNKLIMEDFENENYNSMLEKIDMILETEPDNPDAIKWKVDILNMLYKYEVALKICDEYLSNNGCDTEMLKLKADLLFAKHKYLDCVLVCRKILQLDPKNKQAKSLIDTAQTLGYLSDEECGKNPLLVMLRKIAIALVILLVIITTHPTSEVVNCDENYNCKIEHKFCHFITYTRYFKLSPNSYINLNTGIKFQKGGSRHVTRAKYDDVSPFIAYFIDERWSEDSERRINEEQDKFWQYTANPQIKYHAESDANPIGLYVFLFFYFIFAIPLVLPQKSHKG